MMTMMTTPPQFHNEDDASLTSMEVKAVATVEKEKDEIILVPMAGGEEEEATDDEDVEKVDEHDDKPVTTHHPVGLAPKHRSLSTSSLSNLAASFQSVLTHTPHNRKSLPSLSTSSSSLSSSSSTSATRHLWNSGRVVSVGSSGSRKSRISILDTTIHGTSNGTMRRSLSNPNMVASADGGGGKDKKMYHYFDGNGNIYWKEW